MNESLGLMIKAWQAKPPANVKNSLNLLQKWRKIVSKPPNLQVWSEKKLIMTAG